MNTINKTDKIFKKISTAPNLEAALLGQGLNSYLWYRFRFLILNSFIFYAMYFIKMIFLGSNYTSFYTTKILVFEQVVFWLAQLFWYFIILMQKTKTNFTRINTRLDIKISIAYSVIVSLIIGAILYKNGLLVFERLTIYGSVSYIFIAQIFIVVHLKYMHSHLYSKKRVYMNMPLVIFVHILLLILQILLWNRYGFWSVPLIFGGQIVINSLVKYWYYKKEYQEKVIENSVLIDFKTFTNFLFSKNIFMALLMLLPEVFYFFLIQINFINEQAEYTTIVFLLSALMSSRITGMLLQDFIKYDSDKYNFTITRYLNKITIPLVLTIFFLFSQAVVMNYLFTHKLNMNVAMIGFIISCLLAINNNLLSYFYSKKNLKYIVFFSLLTCFVVYACLLNYIYGNYALCISYGLISFITYGLFIKQLPKIENQFLNNITYTKKAFEYLFKKK